MAAHAIRPIGPDTLADLRRLLGGPGEGWCWCVAWEVPEWRGWTDRTAAENRALREALWREGAYHGYLLELDGAAVGWCRVGPASAWPKLVRERDLAGEAATHVFTCFNLVAAQRGQGHMHAFLALVLEALRAAGVRRVLAIPRAVAGRVDDGHVWTGPPGLFARAGFAPVRATAQYRLLARDL